MHAEFTAYVESLHPLLEDLLLCRPFTVGDQPKGRNSPKKCIYLFSEGADHLYVGRTHRQSLRRRLGQHSNAGSQHNQAVFAFRLARVATGMTAAAYTKSGSRRALLSDATFNEAFVCAKAKIRGMDVRFVEVDDPLTQALLEVYAAFVLKTPFNDFGTH